MALCTFGVYYERSVPMHCHHNIFVEAIRDKKKVRLTFLSEERGDSTKKLCGPVFYSASVVEKDLGCYCLWDFESNTGNHFLALSPSQIVSMELTKEPFDLVEFFTSRKQISDS